MKIAQFVYEINNAAYYTLIKNMDGMFMRKNRKIDKCLQLLKKICYNVSLINKKGVSAMDTGRELITHGEVDSVDFAIYLNKKAQDLGKVVNITKIQKWLYICYGLYLVVNEKQLLAERPKAWDYGPAFPRVHKKQKKNNNDLANLISTIKVENFVKYDSVIQATLANFGDWTASELVAWTHEPNKAWDKTLKAEGIYSVMSNENILSDFKEILKDG